MLSIRALSVSYGTRRVLDGVSLHVGAGEVVALVGPNGCGKTTLIRAVTRVAPWVSGEIYVGEAPVDHLGARDLARLVAVVPQNPLLPLGYTAAEVVLMGRTPHLGFFDQEGPDDYARSEAALRQVGALDLAGRRVDELSGGERQNVVLARALAQDAPLLLLDEPTANLDIGHEIGVARLMRELAAGGKALLAAVHDLTLASLYADRIVLMAKGRVITSGAPAEVMTEANLRQAYGVGVTVLTSDERRPVILPLRSTEPGD